MSTTLLESALSMCQRSLKYTPVFISELCLITEYYVGYNLNISSSKMIKWIIVLVQNKLLYNPEIWYWWTVSMTVGNVLCF